MAGWRAARPWRRAWLSLRARASALRFAVPDLAGRSTVDRTLLSFQQDESRIWVVQQEKFGSFSHHFMLNEA
jgi:hypothetical protein